MQDKGQNKEAIIGNRTRESRTRFALFAMNLAGEPLLALYSLFPFIMRHDMGASSFQIALFVMLRPLLSVFSFYWSSLVSFRPGSLKLNLMLAWAFAYLPFLLFPLFSNFWYLLLAAGLYQLFSRAAIPAWIEILKSTLPKEKREFSFSLSYILSFLESALLGVGVGLLLDHRVDLWRTLFAVSAVIGLGSLVVQSRLLLKVSPENIPVKTTKMSFLSYPWKKSFQLLKSLPDFAAFQWVFMFGGGALMLMAPALPLYYSDSLKLTHFEITTARFFCMTLGVTLTTMLWKRGLQRLKLKKLLALILVGFSLFSSTLLLTPYNPYLLYLAFFIYGIAQAGSHLVWSLSGPLFAGESDSSPYTSVNVMMVGIRGVFLPCLGFILCDLMGAETVIYIGTALSILGIAFACLMRAKQSKTIQANS